MLRETMSRDLCGLVCPSRTSERGGEGDCVKELGGGEGERERVCVFITAVPITKLFACGSAISCEAREFPASLWPRRRVNGTKSFVQALQKCVCFITAGPITKLFAWGEEESGGHVL